MTTQNQNLFKTKISADIVSAYVKYNPVSVDQLPDFINEITQVVDNISRNVAADNVVNDKPAVPIKKSLQQKHLVCLECGKEFKSLKRHLRTYHNLRPEEYRMKWNLPVDYPMVAPAYAEVRSNVAKIIGLGKKASRINKQESS